MSLMLESLISCQPALNGELDFAVSSEWISQIPTNLPELKLDPGEPEPRMKPRDGAIRARPDQPLLINLYFRDIGVYERLTVEEERELSARIKQGDSAARERMIMSNLRLVVKIARDFDGLGLPLLDLINEGNIGLMKAVEKYDPSKGAKLSTYASFYIKQAIRLAIANQSRTIRLPMHVQEKLQSIGKAAMRLQHELDHEPTATDLAGATGLKSHRLTRYRTAARPPISLDQPATDRAASPSDTIACQAPLPSEQACQAEALDILRAALALLPERERQVLQARFGLPDGDPQTLNEISIQMGLSRERIRQLEIIGIRKVRQHFKQTHEIAGEETPS